MDGRNTARSARKQRQNLSVASNPCDFLEALERLRSHHKAAIRCRIFGSFSNIYHVPIPGEFPSLVSPLSTSSDELQGCNSLVADTR